MVSACWADQGISLPDRKAKDSYSLGYEFGSNLKAQEVDLDKELLITAIREALEGKQPAMKMEEIHDNLKQLRKQVLIRYNLRRNQQAEKIKTEGITFLAANKGKEGVKTLPSGLQYKVLKEGDGPLPLASDMVKVSYRGTLLDGTEFDSSYARGVPETIRVNGKIKGWTEALQLMKVGAKWQLFVPAALAHGDRQYGMVPPNSVLVFELELLSIENVPTD